MLTGTRRESSFQIEDGTRTAAGKEEIIIVHSFEELRGGEGGWKDPLHTKRRGSTFFSPSSPSSPIYCIPGKFGTPSSTFSGDEEEEGGKWGKG